MKTLLEQLKTIDGSRGQHVYNAKYISKLRELYLKDPVVAVNEADYSKGVSRELEKFKAIFETPNNIELAKEDGLTILNKSLLSVVSDIVATDKKYIDTVNEIITAVNNKADTFKTYTRDVAAINVIEQALKYLPYLEKFNYKVSKKLHVIMSRDGIERTNALEWLYGIATDLDEENLSGLINAIDIMKIYSFLEKDLDVKLPYVELPSIVMENGDHYSTIKHLYKELSVPTDLALLLKHIYRNLQTDKNIIATSQPIDTLSIKTNIEAVYQEINNKLSDDPTASINIDTMLQSVSEQYNKLKYITTVTLQDIVSYYNELSKLLDTAEFIVEVVVKE